LFIELEASPPEPENIRTRLAGLLQNDNAEAAAGAIASAGSEGFGSSSAVAAGTAAVNQAIAGKVESVAESFAVAAAQDTAATAAVLAKAAVEARSRGDARAFARSQVSAVQPKFATAGPASTSVLPLQILRQVTHFLVLVDKPSIAGSNCFI
jgi:hypothetical protein